MTNFKSIQTKIHPLRYQLLNHSLYQKLTTVKAVQVFMSYHVFAVWDFMSLLKSLQSQLTCVTYPWTRSSNVEVVRLINEIVIAEESDLTQDEKGYASHFDLYLEAMGQLGADPAVAARLDTLCRFLPPQQAIERCQLPAAVQTFLTFTLQICEHPAHEVASAFVFGREGLVPDLFTQLIQGLGVPADKFTYYLNRHIEIDGDEHGPAAQKMIEALCGQDSLKWSAVETIAQQALLRRIELWDAISQAIDVEIHQKAAAAVG
jgi:hypothetical protein